MSYGLIMPPSLLAQDAKHLVKLDSILPGRLRVAIAFFGRIKFPGALIFYTKS
jgi:hypothetical protein